MTSNGMVRFPIAGAVVVGLFMTFAWLAPSTVAQTKPAPGIGKDAAAILARMNKTLLAQKFSFEAHTIRAYVGQNGELLHIAHDIKTLVRRPNRLAIDTTGDDGSLELRYDGKAIVAYGVEQKKYASIPVSGGIDEALDHVEDRTGIDFPLSDLLTSDPEDSLLSDVTAGGQVGTATIGGVKCLHLYFVQAPDMEFELWLEDNDRALPRRLVVTYRGLPGRPTFIAELSNWNLDAQAPDDEFAFNPPAGAMKVDLRRSSGALPASSK